ncbi:MAG: PEP-CTERM motif protein [Candidatus Scalindua rubra]|uniref:PEP-CTERM motif protein n=1 Tax=Candidatus Scalindua rubra TaxID=1872076 RepID=A0A1E3X648_9BACT|nr:MAG: PEP-CTERM motif protein [Candidatus Scalindua rubra]
MCSRIGRSYGVTVFMALVIMLVLQGTSNAVQLTTTWNGGAGNWNVAGNWSGGVVPNNGVDTFNVLIDNGNATNSSVSLDTNATIDNLTIDALDSLGINNGRILTVVSGATAGTVSNAGTISMNSVGNTTDLLVSGGNVNLTGGGTVTMSDNVNNRMGSFVSTNQSLIDANQTNLLTIDPSATGAINTGTMQASSGGTLRLQGGTFTNTGGTIQALDGSLVELGNTTTITGGTLTTAGTGVIRHISGAATLDGIGLTNAGAFENNNATTTTLIGTITNTGTVAMNSTGSFTDLKVSGTNVNLGGAGMLTMSNFTNNRIHGVVSTNRLTNQAGHTIQGAGQIGVNFMALTNEGTINANQANSLTIDLSSAGINDGTFKASSGGTLIVKDDISGTGNWIADAGTINLTSLVDVTTTGNIDILNGGSLNLTNATMTGNNLNMSGVGSSISVNSSIELAGNLLCSITNEADYVWGAASSLQMNGFNSFLELGGQDLGTNPATHTGAAAGFMNNFNLEELIIGSGAKLHLVDIFDNANRGGTGGFDEALYVDTLTFADASGILNLNSLHLYFNTLIGDSSQIIDEPIQEPTTITLFGIGLAGLGGGYLRRRIRKNKVGS